MVYGSYYLLFSSIKTSDKAKDCLKMEIIRLKNDV